jgi:hypothetical protein
MNRIIPYHLILLLWVSISAGYAQTTSLSGSINTTATAVTSVASTSVNVTTTAGFALNDIVLIIQMKGATMNETNSASFGAITSIGNAGNYELAVICDIVGSTITFQTALTRTYTATGGFVQLIRVPNYVDVNVNGLLTAPAWNIGTKTGGVLVIYATESVTLNANINMDARGFRGGWAQNNYSACTCGCGTATQYPNFFYPSATCRAASKGEGIADTILTKEFGKGPQVNGGGGGNDHNAGGGGGANYGAGGLGGTSTSPSCILGAYCRGLHPGLGGLGLSAHYGASNKIFLGGGGGAGHSNNPLDTRGRPGGGIVIIIANSLVGQGNTISARGGDVTALNDGDGAGGGGAGGTILLNVPTITSSPLTLNATGGYGGNLTAATATNCKGPGGGGGGGAIWSQTALPGTVTTTVAGGANGAQLSGSCIGQTMGTTAGGIGAVITGLSMNLSSLICTTILPVEMSDVVATCGDNEILLQWFTASEFDNDYFGIQFSMDGFNYESIGAVEGAGESQDTIHYSYIISQREYLKGYYRLKQVDFNGDPDYSMIVSINCLSDEAFVQIVDGKLIIQNGSTITDCTIYDMLGREIFSGNPTKMDFNLEADSFYFVRLESANGFTNHTVYSQ